MQRNIPSMSNEDCNRFVGKQSSPQLKKGNMP